MHRKIPKREFENEIMNKGLNESHDEIARVSCQ